jgi:hypothetical protein
VAYAPIRGTPNEGAVDVFAPQIVYPARETPPTIVSGDTAPETDVANAGTVAKVVSGGIGAETDVANAGFTDFSPDQIAGLECWLKADTIGLADGANVTTWEDSHTSNKDATSSSGQTYQTNEINGLGVVRFDGTDDVMSVAGITNNDATRTIFCVQRNISVALGDVAYGWALGARLASASNTGTVGWSNNAAAATQAIGTQPGTGVTFSTTMRFNSISSADGWVNDTGPTNFDPDNVYSTGSTALSIGARPVAQNCGNIDLAELLIYDSALSDTDVALVQTYLEDKWIPQDTIVSGDTAAETDVANAGSVAKTVSGGTATETDVANAGTVAKVVSAGTATETDVANAGFTDFSPDQIAGLQFWLDADAIGGLSDNDTVSTWPNPGALADAASSGGPTWQTNELNGQSIVRFDGVDDYFTLDSALETLNPSAATVFIVVKIDADPPSGSKWGLWAWNSGQGTTYPWTGDGVIYEAFGTDTRKVTGDPSLSLASWRIYCVKSAHNAWTSYLDGTQHYTTASNTVSWASSPYYLGRSNGSGFLDGDVAELLLYDTALSDTDRQDVEAYLADKWIPADTIVPGDTASETDVANAGTVTKTVSAGTGAETDAANAGTVLKTVSDATAAEADAANAGTVAKTVSGGTALETDSAQAGTTAKTVSGGQGVETDTAPAGTVQGGTNVAGDTALETDVANAGTTSKIVLGSSAVETDVAPEGSTTGGAQPPETNPNLGGVVSEPDLGGVFDETVTGGVFDEPSHGGNVTEPTLGGVFDETATGGEVTEPDEGAEIDNLLGGVIDEVLTNGSVTESSINGNVTEPALNGAVTEPDLGALLDEAIRSSQIDEATRSGTPDESNRGGTIDEVLTGGEIF